MFAKRYNRKLPLFVSPVPDKKAWAVDSEPVLGRSRQLCLSSDLPDSKCCKQDSQPLSKNNSDIPRVAQHVMNLESSEPIIPDTLCLPTQANLLTQPFNRSQHRDLTNLNLCPWLLEPRTSMTKLQNELKILKNTQSTKQSGPFFSMEPVASGGHQGAIYKPNS